MTVGYVFRRAALMGALYVVVAGLPFSVFAADARTKWTSLLIVDVGNLPLDEHPRFGSKSKTFFRGPDTGSFVYSHWAPTWDTELLPSPLGSHYHHWSEWAYMLDGDFLIQESVNPGQQNGVLNRFTEGTWLDRPVVTATRPPSPGFAGTTPMWVSTGPCRIPSSQKRTEMQACCGTGLNALNQRSLRMRVAEE